MAAKTIKYDSLAERFLAERSEKELIRMLIAIMEDKSPGAFDEGVNKLFPQANGEPYALEYTKPQ
jgi:hypothetical protein